MRTEQSRLVAQSLATEHCREVYGRRPGRAESAPPVPPTLNYNGIRVTKAGRVEFATRGFALVRWDDGTTSSEWFADLGQL